MTKEQNNLILDIIEAVSDKKGRNISIVDLSENPSAPARQLIIATGNNPAQVNAIADSVRERVIDKHSMKPVNYEGYRNSQWIIIDYGHIMVHVFLPDFRTFYNLESLWNDFPIENIPDLD